MTTLLHSEISNGTSDSDEMMSDFVVLPSDTLSPIPGDMPDMQVLENLRISVHSDNSEMPAEEAEKWIRELLRENAELKQTLMENTGAMKQQFQTLVTWQQQVNKFHQHHKQMLDEARSVTVQLRQENASLKKQMEQCQQESCDTLLDDNFSVITKGQPIDGTNGLSDKQECSESLIGSGKDIKGKNSESKEGSSTHSEHLESGHRDSSLTSEAFVRSFLSKIPGLKFVDDADAKGSDFQLKVPELLVKFHDEQTKTAELTQELQQERALGMEYREKMESALRELENLKALLKEKEKVAEKERNAAESKVLALKTEKEDEIIAFRKEISHLKKEIEKLRTDLQEMKMLKEVATKNAAQHFENYQSLLKTWQEFENHYVPAEGNFVHVQSADNEALINNLRAAVTGAQENLQLKCEELRAHEEEICQLRASNENLKLELEVLPALKAQLELYESDYKTEKDLRIELERKVQELKGALTEMQTQNSGLLSELQNRSSSSSEQQSQAGAAAQVMSNSSFPYTNMQKKFVCPLCNAAFKDSDSVVNHVERCLVEDYSNAGC